MFVVKKIFGILLAPATIILLLLAAGLFFLGRSGQKGRRGALWFWLALGGFYLFTTALLPNLLLRPLEGRYPPLSRLADLTDIRYIVILAGGPVLPAEVPAASRLNGATVRRVLEGIRLYYLLEQRPVVVMSGNGDPPTAAVMVALAQSLGVAPDKLVSENTSPDTHGNAQAVKAIVQDAAFILVTSAAHLPRSMAIFQHLGMQPVPAPADFRGQGSFCWKDLVPRGKHVTNIEDALHEYLGLAYLSLVPGRAGR